MKRELRRELLAVLGFVLIFWPYVVLFQKLGWLGFWITSSILTGSLMIMLTGLPRIFTDEIKLPADTREKLGWHRDGQAVDRRKAKP